MRFTCSVFICVLGLTHEGWSEYGDRIKNATVVWGDNLQMEESRHGGYAIVPPPPTDLPVTFQAPFINAPNYWSNAGRRTVLDYQPYVGQDIITRPITEGINTFYGLMNQFFGTEEPVRRPPPPPSPFQQPVKARPEFEYPYHPQNLRPFYLPGPKPLRASIQKLEPPRNNFSPAERPNNYPQFVKILNDVLLENAYNYREQVIEKPVYEYENIIPTTYKPNYFKVRATSSPAPFPVSIQDQLPPVQSGQDTRIPYVTETTTVLAIRSTAGSKVVFPADSEQIQQPLDFSIDVRNSNSPIAGLIVETTTTKTEPSTTHPPTTPNAEITTNGETGINHSNEKSTTEKSSEIIQFPLESSSERSEKDNIVDTKKDDFNSAKPTESSIITTTDILTTTIESVTQIPTLSSPVPLMVTELLDTMEPLQSDRTRSQYPKKLNSRKVTTDATNSADYVTDLTLQGLNDSNAVHVSVPKRFKPFNMSLVLNYVIGELNATAPPINEKPVDDGLSLDAKILRDTQWDGYQPVIPTTTTEMVTDTTTISSTFPTTTDTPTKETTEPIKFEEEITTMSPRTKRLRVATTTSVVPIRKSLRTTTVYPIVMTTSYPITTAEIVTTPFEKPTEIIATRVTQTVSKSLRQRQRTRTTTTDDSVISPRGLDQENSSTEITSTTRKGRKYQRKPKSHNFTQFSSKSTTQAPLKVVPTGRTFYPKKSRVNGTSTFNYRDKKINDEGEKTAKKISSAEEQTTRRNLYKRRKHPSQIRNPTEES